MKKTDNEQLRKIKKLKRKKTGNSEKSGVLRV